MSRISQQDPPEDPTRRNKRLGPERLGRDDERHEIVEWKCGHESTYAHAQGVGNPVLGNSNQGKVETSRSNGILSGASIFPRHVSENRRVGCCSDVEPSIMCYLEYTAHDPRYYRCIQRERLFHVSFSILLSYPSVNSFGVVVTKSRSVSCCMCGALSLSLSLSRSLERSIDRNRADDD